jgi:hypothetical protein
MARTYSASAVHDPPQGRVARIHQEDGPLRADEVGQPRQPLLAVGGGEDEVELGQDLQVPSGD